MRFVLTIIAVWLTCVASIIGALLYGRLNPMPNRLQMLGFNVCSDRLCLIGIIPGVTSPADTATILVQHGALFGGKYYVIGDERINFPNLGTTIAFLTITTQPHKPMPVTVGDALVYLGNPCRMERYFEG